MLDCGRLYSIAGVVSRRGGGGALNTNGRGTTHANHRRCTIRDARRLTRRPPFRYPGPYTIYMYIQAAMKCEPCKQPLIPI